MSNQAKSQWDFGNCSRRNKPQSFVRVGADRPGPRAAGETRRPSGWAAKSPTSARKFRPHLFHAQGRGGAVELRPVQPREVPHRDLLADGQKVLLQGDVTVYEARGQYQLIVRAVELQGVGALQIAFEKLKQKLAAEGLFAPERKRPLPEYPQRIGLVTSPTGAAIRDVLHVVQRRQSGFGNHSRPCRVQGDGAAAEIAEAIRTLNEFTHSRLATSELGSDFGHARRRVAGRFVGVQRGGGGAGDF